MFHHISMVTLPKANTLHLRGLYKKRKLIFQPPRSSCDLLFFFGGGCSLNFIQLADIFGDVSPSNNLEGEKYGKICNFLKPKKSPVWKRKIIWTKTIIFRFKMLIFRGCTIWFGEGTDFWTIKSGSMRMESEAWGMLKLTPRNSINKKGKTRQPPSHLEGPGIGVFLNIFDWLPTNLYVSTYTPPLLVAKSRSCKATHECDSRSWNAWAVPKRDFTHVGEGTMLNKNNEHMEQNSVNSFGLAAKHQLAGCK